MRIARCIILGLALVACKESPLTLPGTPVAVTIIGTAGQDHLLRDNPNFTARERIVVSSQAQWEEVWARFDSGKEIPAVDFTTSTVIVASMGVRNTGGFGISVEGASRQGENVYAKILERSPGRGCFTTQAITFPVTVTVIATQTTAVEFIEATETRRC